MMAINWRGWFQYKVPNSDDIDARNVAVSDAIGKFAKRFDDDESEIIKRSAASLNFLAVLTGTGDSERLYHAASTLNRLAINALDEFSDPKPSDPQEELNRLIERGVDIACDGIRHRNWSLVTEHLAKVMFLDDLLEKTKRGEVVMRDQWPDVVG